MKTRTQTKQAFTLVEIMVVVVIIGLLAAIVVPSFIRSREEAVRKSCVNNLLQIYNAKIRWGLDNHKLPTDVPTAAELFGPDGYIRYEPTCPGGGIYSINAVDTPPSCSLTNLNHTLP
jgi:general secretion pathway protein G